MMDTDSMPARENPAFANLRVQARVINALILRETKTLYGHSKLGFLWAFLEPFIVLLPLWTVFYVTGMDKRLPFGMNVPLFVLSGEGAWLMFSHTCIKMIPAVKANRPMLAYPQITPLDFLVARAILNGVIKTAFFFLTLVLLLATGHASGIYSYPQLLWGLGTGWLIGVGFGLIGSAVCVVMPSIETIIAPMLRFFFFASGIMFSLDMVPLDMQPYVLMNPLFHTIELTRGSLCPTYARHQITAWYPLAVGFLVVFLGLVFERNVRRKIELL